MMCKMSVWVWHCNAPQGGYLFYGNPNRGLPSFHFGGIENILCGERLVWEHTRKALEMDVRIMEWNEWFPNHRVKPKLITIEMRPADPATRSRRKKKEGGANVPVFVKQLDIGGRCVTDINRFPAHLRIRQVPWAKEGVDK